MEEKDLERVGPEELQSRSTANQELGNRRDLESCSDQESHSEMVPSGGNHEENSEELPSDAGEQEVPPHTHDVGGPVLSERSCAGYDANHVEFGTIDAH